MSTLRRAVGNSSVLMASQLITWTAALLLTAALGRSLGDTGFGQLYLAMSYAAIFGVLCDLGLDPELVRTIARDRKMAGPYLANAIAVKAALSVVAYLTILVISAVLNYPAQLQLVIAVYGVTLFFRTFATTFTAVYQASEQMLHSAVATILEKTLVAIVALFLLHHGQGVVAVATAFVGGAAMGVIWQALFIRRTLQSSLSVDLRVMRALVKSALPFLLYRVLRNIYGRIDTLLLSVLVADTAVVGWYGAAYRLFDTLHFLPVIVSSSVMYPILSRLSVTSENEFRTAVVKGLDIMLILGVPICTGMFVLAGPIIRLVYGEQEFLPAVPALRWLAVGLFITYVNFVLGTVITSLNKERKLVVAATLSVIVNVGLNLLLIPHFQHIAAAAITTGTEFIILCYLFVMVPKSMLSLRNGVVLLKAIAAAGTMSGVLYTLSGRSLLILIPVGAVVYGVTGLLLRIVPPEDIQLLKSAVWTRRSPSLAGPESRRG